MKAAAINGSKINVLSIEVKGVGGEREKGIGKENFPITTDQ